VICDVQGAGGVFYVKWSSGYGLGLCGGCIQGRIIVCWFARVDEDCYGEKSCCCKDTDTHFLFLYLSMITSNGFGLWVWAGFGAQNCQFTTKVDAK
jgi:hypothetical protein